MSRARGGGHLYVALTDREREEISFDRVPILPRAGSSSTDRQRGAGIAICQRDGRSRRHDRFSVWRSGTPPRRERWSSGKRVRVHISPGFSIRKIEFPVGLEESRR